MIQDSMMASMAFPLPEDADSALQSGDIALAGQILDGYLKRDIPPALRARLTLEKHFLPQMEACYPLTRDDLVSALQQHIPGFSAGDLLRLLQEGWLDTRMARGQRMYMKDTVDSLLKAHPDIAARAGQPLQKENPQLDDMMRAVKAKGHLAMGLSMDISLRIREDCFVPGTAYRVHLPLPRPGISQKNIRVLDAQPTPKHIARESAPQRTAYYEEVLEENRDFTASFSFEQHIRYANAWDGEAAIAYPHAPPPTAEDLGEQAPHILFTPYLKALAMGIKGEEVFPLRIARNIYKWITTDVRYAYQRPYRLIPGGAEYTAINLRGDCGLQALLFITLCRILGIPARWESGLFASPQHVGSHDWAQFYTEACGWLPADCSFGGTAARCGNEERHQFYFGNLDPYRMAANNQYYAPFQPARLHLRNDPYDNQRGEAETLERPLESHEYDTRFTLTAHQLLP